MNFHKRGHVFVVQKNYKKLYDLCIPFDYLKKLYFTHLITLVYMIQNDIYIVSKLFFNIFINFKYIILFIDIQ
jgi:hypothetical protein